MLEGDVATKRLLGRIGVDGVCTLKGKNLSQSVKPDLKNPPEIKGITWIETIDIFFLLYTNRSLHIALTTFRSNPSRPAWVYGPSHVLPMLKDGAIIPDKLAVIIFIS